MSNLLFITDFEFAITFCVWLVNSFLKISVKTSLFLDCLLDDTLDDGINDNNDDGSSEYDNSENNNGIDFNDNKDDDNYNNCHNGSDYLTIIIVQTMHFVEPFHLWKSWIFGIYSYICTHIDS